MSDGLITRRSPWVVVPLQVLAIVVVFAGAGLLCGLLWIHQWQVPTGVVSGGEWFTDETGLRQDFAGTGWYVVIAVLAGLVLGLAISWLLDRAEVLTLLAVAVGSVLAGYLMVRVGYHLSPLDPTGLAKTAADGTKLDGALRLHGWTPRLAFPFGALLGLLLIYLTTSGGGRSAGSAGNP